MSAATARGNTLILELTGELKEDLIGNLCDRGANTRGSGELGHEHGRLPHDAVDQESEVHTTE